MDSNGAELYCELVVHIAVRLYEIPLGKPANRETTELKGHEFDDEGHGHFEDACQVLVEAGVVDPHPRFRSYRAKFDVPDMLAFLRASPEPNASTLQKALSAFLPIAVDYGDYQPITEARQPFRIPQGLESLFRLFIECGYAKRRGHLVQWTEKMAPAMYEAGLWEDPEVVAQAQRRREAYLEELEAMWQTMPADICVEFFTSDSGGDDELGQIVARFWYDGKWQSEGLDIDQVEPSRRRRSGFYAQKLWKKFHEAEKKK